MSQSRALTRALSFGLSKSIARPEGVGGWPASWKALAQKVVTRQAAFTTRTVVSSAPTITRSADFAASTIGGGDAGSPTYAPNDVRVRTGFQLINQFGSWYGDSNTDDIRLDGGDGWCGGAIQTTARAIELGLGFGNNYQMQMRITPSGGNPAVDGQWIGALDTDLFSGTASFNPRFIKVDNGSTALRTIEWYLRHSQDMTGFNLSAGSSPALPAVFPINVFAAMIWDSYAEANGGLYNPMKENPTQRLFERMGMLDGVPMGRSNQGYVLTRDGRTIAGRAIIDLPRLIPGRPLDIIFIVGSVNDYNQSATTLQTNFAATVAAAMSAFPNAIIIAYSSIKTQNNTIDATRNAAIVNGARSVADFRTLVIDTQGLSWETMAATSGLLLNGQAHTSPDGVHTGQVNETPNLVDNYMIPAAISAIKSAAGIP